MFIECGRVALARETELLGENPSITNPTWAELFLTTSVNIRFPRHFFLGDSYGRLCVQNKRCFFNKGL